jgi:2-iminoacetate synthase
MVQLLCAFRIFSHELELSLSTRESPDFRENLLPLGVTSMSAGSKTNPGGYANREQALEQFEVSDQRSPGEICRMLEEKGYDPIFKDWDLCYDNPECLKGTFPHEVAGKSGKRDLVEAS